MQPTIGIVIPTFQAAKHLPHCLPPLLHSPLKPRLLIIDSSSTDDTVAIARSMGAETLIIPKREFNHGATREKARRYLNTSIIVMMTQDAYAVSAYMLNDLVKPLIDKQASIAYARQLPHLDANFFAAFSRCFNYPSTSHIRSFADVSFYGAYTFFCSNSCAAYLNCTLDEIGGFPSVTFGEDTVVVAQLLLKQHRIAYVAEAEVRHSHNYTLKQEFQRHLEMGWARYIYYELLSSSGSEDKRGKIYVQSLIKNLWSIAPGWIPYALLQSVFKWMGYRLGQVGCQVFKWWKKI